MALVTKSADFELIAKMNNQIPEFSVELNKAMIEERIGDKNYIAIVTYCDDEPAGFLVAYEYDNLGSTYCWITAVLEKYRRKGVLGTLMDHYISWSKQLGCQYVRLKSWNTFLGMRSFLAKNDWHIHDIEKFADNEKLPVKKYQLHYVKYI